MIKAALLSVALGMTSAASACEVALVLAVDVSGSVDPNEFRIQRDGLAAALRDPTVAEALVQAQAEVTVLQWTGSSRQQVSIPWTKVHNFAQASMLADLVANDPRIWRNFSTAIGEALDHAHDLFDQVPQCTRRVVDVSGDGASNEGVTPREIHPKLAAKDITVNALVIEGAEEDLTGYFWENVITGPGAFVVTANGFADYPDRIRQKLLREITKQVASR